MKGEKVGLLSGKVAKGRIVPMRDGRHCISLKAAGKIVYHDDFKSASVGKISAEEWAKTEKYMILWEEV